jgi:hypothetical protein
MSNFEKKSQKTSITTLQKQSLKTTKNPNQSFKTPSINSFILQAKKITANTWLNLQKI